MTELRDYHEGAQERADEILLKVRQGETYLLRQGTPHIQGECAVCDGIRLARAIHEGGT